MTTASSRRPQQAAPRLLQAVLDALRQPDLRNKLLFTFALLIVFRFLSHVPTPGVDKGALDRILNDNPIFGFFDLFSGGAFKRLAIASMGVYPYITASIAVQLMTPIIPVLRNLAEEGEQGRQKINQITHWLTVPLAILQAFGQLILLEQGGVISNIGFGPNELFPTAVMVLSMTAATMFLVWLGELITEHGIGNGLSIIIFGGIVAGMPSLIQQTFVNLDNFSGLMLFLVAALGIVFLIVVFTEATRRIPVEYGRTLFRGGRMYRQGGSTFIPLRVNSAGMIPLIFAISIVILPGVFASYLSTNTGWSGSMARFISDLFNPSGYFYWSLFFFLTVGFAFFYTLVIFTQQKLAENLQKNGGFIPGLRPGKPTDDYLTRVILRITWGGALFLGLVAITPFIIEKTTGVTGLLLSSTSVLIVVGVVLDTMRQLEAQLLMRDYEGFLKQ